MKFQKGHKINIGKKNVLGKHWKLSDIAKENHRISAIGKNLDKKRTQECKDKLRDKMIGKKHALGHKHTAKAKEKIGLAHKGDNNCNWKGGISFNSYPKEFNKELKLKIRQRDNFTCQLCEMTEKESLVKYGRVLSVNHIDYNKDNCNENNLNSLCCSCNFIVNGERDKWSDLFKRKLLVDKLELYL